MTYILGIDPGTTETAYCLIDKEYQVMDAGKVENEKFIKMFSAHELEHPVHNADLAVESIQSYGMPVGREVFETAYMIGRIIQKARDGGISYTLYPRPEYAKAICGTQKISDSILRQALLLRFGDDKKGGPLFQLKGCTDKRSAFAIAAYHLDMVKNGPLSVHKGRH